MDVCNLNLNIALKPIELKRFISVTNLEQYEASVTKVKHDT